MTDRKFLLEEALSKESLKNSITIRRGTYKRKSHAEVSEQNRSNISKLSAEQIETSESEERLPKLKFSKRRSSSFRNEERTGQTNSGLEKAVAVLTEEATVSEPKWKKSKRHSTAPDVSYGIVTRQAKASRSDPSLSIVEEEFEHRTENNAVMNDQVEMETFPKDTDDNKPKCKYPRRFSSVVTSSDLTDHPKLIDTQLQVETAPKVPLPAKLQNSRNLLGHNLVNMRTKPNPTKPDHLNMKEKPVEASSEVTDQVETTSSVAAAPRRRYSIRLSMLSRLAPEVKHEEVTAKLLDDEALDKRQKRSRRYSTASRAVASTKIIAVQDPITHQDVENFETKIARKRSTTKTEINLEVQEDFENYKRKQKRRTTISNLPKQKMEKDKDEISFEEVRQTSSKRHSSLFTLPNCAGKCNPEPDSKRHPLKSQNTEPTRRSSRKSLASNSAKDVSQQEKEEKKVKRLPPTLETIFEEVKRPGDYYTKQKFKRVLNLNEDNAMLMRWKIKRRVDKAKRMADNRYFKREELSMDLFMRKIEDGGNN